jgi:pimeloyl-ACP methyl ester carboxylesterase
MPVVTRRGRRIHYTVDGAGPLVVLQHGLFLDADSWARAGFVRVLAERFRVACVDSLGHGLSDKPAEADAYGQAERAADVVAVIDDLGAERAHLVGHSMGGWLAVGVARRHPRRLASLTVAGWDLVGGVASALPAGVARPLPFERILANARSAAPSLVGWVTPEAEPGLRACWEALDDLAGAEAAVLGAGVPVLLWSGRDDPYHDPMRTLAAAHGFAFLSTPGDHLGAVMDHGGENAPRLRAFLEAA